MLALKSIKETETCRSA